MSTSLLFNDPEYKQLSRNIEDSGCDPVYLTLHQTAIFAKRFGMFMMSAKCYAILAGDTENKEDVGYYMYRAGELLLMSPATDEINILGVDYLILAALECDHIFAIYSLATYYENNKDYEKAELYYKLYCAKTKDTPEYPQIALRYSLMLLLKLKRTADALVILHTIIYYYEQCKDIYIIDQEFNETTPMTDVFNFYGSVILYTFGDIAQGLEYLKTGYHTYNNETCRDMLYLYYTTEDPDRKQATKYRIQSHDDCNTNTKRRCI
jgi:hypothetical protein